VSDISRDKIRFEAADAMQWMIDQGYLEEYWEEGKRMVKITPKGYDYYARLQEATDE
jgi:DNA-binding PadR family transcriptional regulator